MTTVRPFIAENATRGARASGVSAQFLAAGAVCLAGLVMLIAGLTGTVVSAGLGVAMASYLVGIGLGLRGLRDYPHPALGLCNLVTLFRLMLVCGLIGALITPAASPWLIFALASVALALDGIDGWLARRDGYVSDFGAAFDMEVDAVLALTLALHAYAGGHVGPFIILLGLPRYAFGAAQMFLPWLVGDLAPRFSRKVVCVVQIAVLIAVLVPVFGRPFTDVMAGLSALALIWSFAIDIRNLWRARR